MGHPPARTTREPVETGGAPMKRIMTSAVADHAGERVRIAGWVHHQRHLAQLSFLLLRDADGVAQVVIEDESVRDAAMKLLPETVIAIEGTVGRVGAGSGRRRTARTGDHRARRRGRWPRRSRCAGRSSTRRCRPCSITRRYHFAIPAFAPRSRSPRRRWPAFVRRSTGSGSPRSRRRRSSVPRRRAAPTCSVSTTSAGARTSLRARSCTSR